MSADVAASVKARLLDDARARGEEFERTLVRFAAERLKAVDEIRRVGNEAVHAAPGLHPPVLSTVARTIQCLGDLFPGQA